MGIKNCLAGIGTAPYATTGCDHSGGGANLNAAEATALTDWGTTPPTSDAITACYAATDCAGTCRKITFRACAGPTNFGDTGAYDPSPACTSDDAQENADTAVFGIDRGVQMVADLDQLLQNQAMPLLKCTFVSEMFADLFIPLCVDAFGGFSLIGAANVLSIIALVVSFPVGVIATKRLVKSQGIVPELAYKGDTEGTITQDQQDPHTVETTQLM